jgi:hypothetical protein
VLLGDWTRVSGGENLAILDVLRGDLSFTDDIRINSISVSVSVLIPIEATPSIARTIAIAIAIEIINFDHRRNPALFFLVDGPLFRVASS